MVIYAIPGLGTTKKLFANQVVKGVEIIVLDWPLPEKKDTMQSYARKFLPQMDLDKPFCLLGVSFGGMLCTELSKIISPQKLFLVSTSKCRKELPWFIKLLKHLPVHKIMSERSHRKLAYHGKWFIGFGKAYIPEYLGMINTMNENYFKYCINIIVTWKRKDAPQQSIHIHGNSDKLLFHKNVKADYIISEGSHAMILFNAEEINKIIERELGLI